MMADGSDLSALERGMSSVLESRLMWAMGRNGMQPVWIESGGFPTVPLRKAIGYTPITPVVAFRLDTIVRTQWLRDQSREWAVQRLSESVYAFADAIARAAARDGATGIVGVDKSSLRTMFEPTKEKDGFQIRFFASLAYDRLDRDAGDIVETAQHEIDVGSFDLGKLPEEIDGMMQKVRSMAREAEADPEMDAVIEGMLEEDDGDVLNT